jgi:hypothetical protein
MVMVEVGEITADIVIKKHYLIFGASPSQSISDRFLSPSATRTTK